METYNLTTSEQLDELYASNAFSIIGLSTEPANLSDFMEWLKESTQIKNERFYIINGCVFNKYVEKNVYPDDLYIVSVSLKDIVDVSHLALARFELDDAHWFRDIIDHYRVYDTE